MKMLKKIILVVILLLSATTLVSCGISDWLESRASERIEAAKKWDKDGVYFAFEELTQEEEIIIFAFLEIEDSDIKKLNLSVYTKNIDGYMIEDDLSGVEEYYTATLLKWLIESRLDLFEFGDIETTEDKEYLELFKGSIEDLYIKAKDGNTLIESSRYGIPENILYILEHLDFSEYREYIPPKIFVITFDIPDGFPRHEAIVVKRGDTIEDPGELYKEGYIFIGWYNKNTKYYFDEPINSNITLKPLWEKIN